MRTVKQSYQVQQHYQQQFSGSQQQYQQPQHQFVQHQMSQQTSSSSQHPPVFSREYPVPVQTNSQPANFGPPGSPFSQPSVPQQRAAQPQYAPQSAAQPQYAPQSAAQPQYAPQSATQPQYAPQSAAQPQYAPQQAAQPQHAQQNASAPPQYAPQNAAQPQYAPQNVAQPRSSPMKAASPQTGRQNATPPPTKVDASENVPGYSSAYTAVQGEWPPKINNAPNMTTTYPSGFKFKENAPVDHSVPVKVVMSQPAFKISQPIRRRGDDKWPPKGFGEPVQEEVREFIKPKKMQRDYGGFFSQNALPNNYAGYRPPPGTQHFGTDENDEEEVEAGVSNM
ncbi:calcium-binding protein P-like isoform X1 [Homarus americanus]|uniref:calcium-binding protein P-like isoform X1 n=1 Tax=Homarus americanus TaxID=6706 RepID=UPI001C43FA90|nr:calcium-binding protein P-like isoform X1 [Homarus americanus]